MHTNKINTEEAATYAAQRGNPDNNDDEILAKAAEILLSRVTQQSDCFTTPETTKQFLKIKLRPLEHEVFACLFLNNQHQLIEYQEMFRGTIDGASVYPREVAKEALRLNSVAMIIAHNHPSGLNEASHADRNITDKLKQALGLFDIRLLDHFIIGDEEPYSFAEHGLI
jgi:DNA repair protein RadC